MTLVMYNADLDEIETFDARDILIWWPVTLEDWISDGWEVIGEL